MNATTRIPAHSTMPMGSAASSCTSVRQGQGWCATSGAVKPMLAGYCDHQQRRKTGRTHLVCSTCLGRQPKPACVGSYQYDETMPQYLSWVLFNWSLQTQISINAIHQTPIIKSWSRSARIRHSTLGDECTKTGSFEWQWHILHAYKTQEISRVLDTDNSVQ